MNTGMRSTECPRGSEQLHPMPGPAALAYLPTLGSRSCFRYLFSACTLRGRAGNRFVFDNMMTVVHPGRSSCGRARSRFAAERTIHEGKEGVL